MSKNKVHAQFILSSVIAIVLATVLGVGTGYLREMWDSPIILLLASILLAYSIRKVGRGVELRFAILGAIAVTVMIAFSDIIYGIGIANLFQFDLYPNVIGSELFNNTSSVMWVLFRAMDIMIGFYYSRVI